MSQDHYCHSSVHQTLDELDFERGIWFAAQHNDVSRVKDLIKKIKNVDLEDKAGYTALHYASRNGHLEVCKLLISSGANVNALTRCGKVSALHRCASLGNLEIFKFLLTSGALIKQQDADGKTVLHRAVEGGHLNIVLEVLKLEPALKNVTDNKGKLPKDYSDVSSEFSKLLRDDKDNLVDCIC